MDAPGPSSEKRTGEAAEEAPHVTGHAHHLQFPLKLKFLDEIKRRNLVRVAILYIVACYVVLEPLHLVFFMLEVPVWANRLAILLMVAGFPFVMLFSWVYEVTPGGIKSTQKNHPVESISRETGQRLNQSIILLLLVAVAMLLVDKFWLGPRAEKTGNVATEVERPEAGTSSAGVAHSYEGSSEIVENSIAVLPFLDMSEKKDQEYFADGISEEILTVLGTVPGLVVISRTSSFQFKGKAEDLREIGRKLNANYILEGSVRQTLGRVRITAQLIDARTGVHVWSENYDRNIKELLALQDEIAAAIARNLQITIEGRPKKIMNDPREIEAYSYYLRGRIAMDDYNPSSLRIAKGYLERAIALNSSFAPAVAALSSTELMIENGDETVPLGLESWKPAFDSAQEAVRLDPTSTEGHSNLAQIAAQRDFDWKRGEQELEAAYRTNPNSSVMLSVYVMVLSGQGKFSDAISRGQASIAVDPLNAANHQTLGSAYFAKGDYTSAMEELQKSIDLDGKIIYSHYLIALIQTLQGNSNQALQEVKLENDAQIRVGGLALVYFSMGRVQDADRELKGFIESVAQTWPFGIARTYAFRGQTDEAFRWLETAYELRDPDLADFVFCDPLLSRLHGDRRWTALMRKMNLMQ